MSVLVVSVVPESSVAGVKICQYVYGHVGVIKESVETVEREPSVWSAVCVPPTQESVFI